MKNFYKLGCLAMLLCQTAKAQITINRSNLGNFIGKSYIIANTETDVEDISVGGAGPNQTWNFSSLGNDFQDSIAFISPFSLPCASDFPTSNLAIAQSIGATYLEESSSFLHILGFCDIDPVSGNSAIKYNNPERIVSFPLTYNSTYSGQSNYVSKQISDIPGFDSTRTTELNNYNFIVDGWGNVTTPEGSFPCLRKKLTSIFTYSFEAKSLGIWVFVGEPSVDTSINYEFYSQNSLFIANIMQDVSGVTTAAAYFKSGSVGVKSIEKNTHAFQVYPNPSQGKFTFSSENAALKTIQIFNTLGAEIGKFALEQGFKDFDLSAFPSGIYHLKVGDGIQFWSQKIVLE